MTADFAKLSITDYAKISIATLAFYIIASYIYTIFFHPLSRFPGPKAAAASYLWNAWNMKSGRLPHRIHDLHKKYGPVVRTGPNSLSFNSSASWRDIYAKQTGKPFLLKGDGYDGLSFSKEHRGLVSERDPEKHARTRKFLGPGFSTKALSEQEPIIAEHAELLMQNIEERGMGKEGMEVHYWANAFSFDVIGNLSFGQSFDSLKNGELHHWVSLALKMFQFTAIMDTMRRYPTLTKLVLRCAPKSIQRSKQEGFDYAASLVDRRVAELENETEKKQKDIYSDVLIQPDHFGLKRADLIAQASSLVVAGSETVATTLGALIYYIISSAGVQEKLAEVIRANFGSYEEINAKEALQIPFLRAAIEETLRLHPAVAHGLPRVTPKEGAVIASIAVPGGVEVFTSPIATTHSAAHFSDPESFKPERWLEKSEKDDLTASRPFLLGPRNCVGMNLAWIEMTLVMAKIMYRYDMKMVNEDLVWERDVKNYILWARPDMYVRFLPRS